MSKAMKNINFTKVDIAKNMTIFVNDEIEQSERANIANRLMDYSHLHAEQVGFLSANNLEMMGGELCVNATLGACGFLAFKEEESSKIISAGMDIKTKAKKISDNEFDCSLELPYPTKITHGLIVLLGLKTRCSIVEFPGITHAIIPMLKSSVKDSYFKTVLNKLNDKSKDAFGVLFYDERARYLTPAVWVKDTDSFVHESACGSGCAAIAAAFYTNTEVDIHQPGGVLRVLAKDTSKESKAEVVNDVIYDKNDDNKECYIKVAARVKIVATGVAYI